MERTRLVITRRHGEAVLIGDSRVKIQLDFPQNRVRLVIEAPPDVRIMREEIERRKGPGEAA